MRIGWTDEEDHPGQFNLWRANCHRSLAGRRGQEALRETEAALLALPDKRLISGAVEHEGEVCAVGAVIKARGLLGEVDECEQTDALAVELLGFPRLVAWILVELNDETLSHVTPEQRYEKVLAEVRSYLKVAK